MATPQTTEVTIGKRDAIRLMHAAGPELDELFARARQIRRHRTVDVVTYSRKVFVPLTNLCRDRCGYCTFARQPDDPTAHTMSPEEVVAVAQAGKRAGCKEALFSLGDKPELRYPFYRDWLQNRGFNSTIDYLASMCRLVFEETGLLPHSNAGVLSARDIEMLRPVNASLGLMLESASERLLRPGEAHYACPDKAPALRLQTLRAAGIARAACTTGILIGIGETLDERVDALFEIREVHRQYGNIQEVIIQNFRAKSDTPFAGRPEPTAMDVARTVAVARLIFGSDVSIQAPPNLNPDGHRLLLDAGINDWGGISPVTCDFINPERAWPQVTELQRVTADAGLQLRERLAIYPAYIGDSHTWLSERFRHPVEVLTGADGLVRRPLERW
jgi:FO synthase